MTSRRLSLTFPERLINPPVIARLVRDFDVTPNIRQAKIEETVGWVLCELSGEADAIDRAVDWMRELGVEVAAPGGAAGS